MEIRRVCVFCGSNDGSNPEFKTATTELAKLLTKKRIGLVYGGGNVGLMGALADAMMTESGEVIGVIPEALIAKEVAHRGLKDLRVVQTMHERKKLMSDLSDAFIALPGGFGTIEEIFEVITWGQLGIHQKPCGFLNVENFYGRLFDFLDEAVAERFITKDHRNMVIVDESPARLLSKFESYEPPHAEKWISQKLS